MTTDVTPELAEAIQRGYDRRDRADMAPTIAHFEALLAEHPDHPVLVYEVGGAYDTMRPGGDRPWPLRARARPRPRR